jgi:transcriptional regulator with XRE-family HTH domain
MSADSPAMRNFCANVRSVIDETDGLSISGLAEMLNQRRRGRDKERVSRSFLSNLLNGHHSCSLPFAEEIAQTIGVPLSTLIESPVKKNLKQTA